MSSTTAGTILSPEDLIQQLDAIQLISSMWSADGELKMEDRDAEAIRKLVEYVNLPISTLGDSTSTKLKESLPSAITLTLLVSPERGLDPEPDSESESQQTFKQEGKSRANRTLLLDVSLPLRSSTAKDESSSSSSPSDRNTTPILRLHTQGLNWLNRSEQDLLTELLKSKPPAEDEEDAAGTVLTKVEMLSERIIDLLKERKTESNQEGNRTAGELSGELSPEVLRTWHYLPSLSTKSKREELCSYAEDAGFTGFVLAGKPGLVVVEHSLPAPSSPQQDQESLQKASLALSNYWSKIKSESWADIPSSHKKVSETLREEYVARGFRDMREMTGAEEIGGQEAIKGERNNRNDLSLVEKWLQGLGLGGKLEGVLGADWK